MVASQPPASRREVGKRFSLSSQKELLRPIWKDRTTTSSALQMAPGIEEQPGCTGGARSKYPNEPEWGS